MALSRIDGLLLEDNSITLAKLTFTPGDMTKAIYDTNDDGIVDSAAVAAAAPWTGITGKPSLFPSVETDVAVNNARFTNWTTAGAYLDSTLDALDTALVAIWQSSAVTVADSSHEDVALGAVADCCGAHINYYLDRNGDYEIGSLLLITDEATTVEVFPMPLAQPTFNVGAPGVTFSGLIAAGIVYLRVTADASGDSAKVLVRWQNSPQQ